MSNWYYIVPPAYIELPANSISIARNDTLWVVELSNHGSTAPTTLLAVGTAKAYLKLDTSGLETPAAGVVWNLNGSVAIFNSLPVDIGDLNCDGVTDFADINPFVLRLSNPTEYFNAYPGCPILNGDINTDGSVDFGDINPFVALLTGGG
jgi:hypothetical protein